MGADPDCPCHGRFALRVAAFEAGVPRDFWTLQASDIKFNNSVFETMVKTYVSKLKLALKRGYGLLFLGANGVGKTTFMSWVLMEAIRRGRTAYYTTLPQLDYDIKRGFNDEAARERLDWMLTSDFLAIDEVGKELFRTEGGSWTKTQLERILKKRFDDSHPVLLATNMDYSTVEKTYGPTMSSIFNGKYQQVPMLPGDYRENLRKKLSKDMGYNK
jgi:DNA replication protein DnaC